jgi:hypothetical protein
MAAAGALSGTALLAELESKRAASVALRFKPDTLD